MWNGKIYFSIEKKSKDKHRKVTKRAARFLKSWRPTEMWPLLAPDCGVLPRCTARHDQYSAAKRPRNGPKTAPSVLHHGQTFYSRESHGFTALSIPTLYVCKPVLASYTSVRFAFCLVMCEYLTVWLGGYCDGRWRRYSLRDGSQGKGGRRAPLVRLQAAPDELGGARNRSDERPVASPPSSTLISPTSLF